MAIVKVRALTVGGRVDDLDAAAGALLRAGCFSPDDVPHTADEGRPAGRDDRFTVLLGELSELLPERTVADDGDRLPDGEAGAVIDIAAVYVSRLRAMRDRDASVRAELEDLRRREDTLSRFAGADFDTEELSRMEFTSMRTGVMTAAAFGRLPERDRLEKLLYYRCSEEGGSVYAAVFSPRVFEAEMDRILSSLDFREIKLPATPSVRKLCGAVGDRIALCERELEENASALADFEAAEGERFDMTVRTLRDETAEEDVKKYASVSGGKFTVTGWIPKSEESRVKALLSRAGEFEIVLEDPDPSSAVKPPSLLRNPRVFRPFEFFVNMFGTPTYGEFDPTPFVAITYILLFGVMFGDLGQGIVVSLVGYFMWRLKKMELGRILIPCGISSAVFGLIYGSVFGFEHVLDPVYRALFGFEEKPIEVMAPATAGTIIYAAVAVGVALVAVAMIINCVVCARRRDWGGLLFGPSGLSGLVFYCAVVYGLVSAVLLGRSVFSVPYIIFLIALPLVLIYLREPLTVLITRSGGKIEWGNYLAQSFFELFESVLSYVTNTMSFLRVGAFVLVHAGMMTVVFTLAGMSSGAAWWIIVAIGNVVVIAIEALLVGIQVLRLEFYEMFSRFFEGGGRPFAAVGRKEAQ